VQFEFFQTKFFAFFNGTKKNLRRYVLKPWSLALIIQSQGRSHPLPETSWAAGSNNIGEEYVFPCQHVGFEWINDIVTPYNIGTMEDT
jgi:hypothetical protein